MRLGFPEDCALGVIQLVKVHYNASKYQVMVYKPEYLLFLLCDKVFPGQYIGEFRQSSFWSHITPRHQSSITQSLRKGILGLKTNYTNK